MNKNDVINVLARLKKEGMAPSDIKLAEDLHYKRATFEMDHYVKLTQIKDTVFEAVSSILDRMGKADALARKNRNELEVLDNKIKSTQ